MTKKRGLLFIVLIAAGVGACLFFREPLQAFLTGALQWAEENPLGGAAILVLCYQVFPLFFLPVTILTLSAGYLYGVMVGFLIVSLAATLACATTFFLGRFLFKDWVTEKTKNNNKMQAFFHAVEKGGWKVVALSRFSIFLPFSILNYGYGASKISFRVYILASALAMLPGSLLYAALGATLSDVQSLVRGDASFGSQKLITLGIALITSVVLVVYLTRKANAYLKESEAQETGTAS